MSAIARAAADALRALCRLEDELDAAWSRRSPLDDGDRSQVGQLRDRWVNETSRKMTRGVKTKAAAL